MIYVEVYLCVPFILLAAKQKLSAEQNSAGVLSVVLCAR